MAEAQYSKAPDDEDDDMMMRFDSISFVAPLFRDKTLNLMFAVLSTNQTTNVGKP